MSFILVTNLKILNKYTRIYVHKQISSEEHLYSAEYTVLYTIYVYALETETTEKIMPPRNRILLEQRQRLIQAFEDVSEDYFTVVATIGMNRSTARSIVAQYLREGRIAERPQGGVNHV